MRQELHEELVLTATAGWKLEDEAYAELQAQRAELDAVWDRHVAMESELQENYREAFEHVQDTKFAAQEARHELTAFRDKARREAELNAELKAARAADAERRAARQTRRSTCGGTAS